MDKKLLFASNRLGVKKDYFKFAFDLYARHTHVQIATPFYTDSNQVLSIVDEQDCTVDLVICLNQATSPDAIEAVMDHPDVNIRYLVDTQGKFHSKLYIFGSEIAFVGSSNMTWQGLNQNIELNLGIESDDPRFEHIAHIFDYYWETSRAMNTDVLEEFRVHHAQNPSAQDMDPVVQNLSGSLGDSGFDRIENRNEKNLLPRKIELFEKHYQKVVSQYHKLQAVYVSTGQRKSSVLPLLWEIDRFLSWVYEGSRVQNSQWDQKKTSDLIAEFMAADIEYIPILEKSFAANIPAVEKLREGSLDENSLRDFMQDVHAFAAR
ncbi:MAG: phospholipase D-like domain-containing protein, partial [bacterium]